MKPKEFEMIFEFIPQITTTIPQCITTGVTYKLAKKGELIRCKDCIYYTGKWCTKYSTKQFDINDICKNDNDFCSQAVRKEE